MKPSRIIKSAHARAGKKVSLKAFARECARGDSPMLSVAASVWLTTTKCGQKSKITFDPLNGPGPTEAEIEAYKRRKLSD